MRTADESPSGAPVLTASIVAGENRRWRAANVDPYTDASGTYSFTQGRLYDQAQSEP
jgi:hypothetical protein